MPDLSFRPPNAVVHPLDDLPEPKLYSADLGRMPLTGRVRVALWLLQAHIGLYAAAARLARADAERDRVTPIRATHRNAPFPPCRSRTRHLA